MNREEIKKLIPHRDDMLLLDSVFIDDEGKANGEYTVTGDEFFLKGHFPGNPVVPGVILCEMMAQTCCVLLNNSGDNVTPYFTGLNKVKFRNVVKPQDKVNFVCEITSQRPPFYFAKGKGFVSGKLSVEGEFSFALMKGE